MVGRPAVLARGRSPRSGCALLMISTATSAAALEAWPAAAALPVSGHRMPILTTSAAITGTAAENAISVAAAAAAFSRRNLDMVSPPSGLFLGSFFGAQPDWAIRHCLDIAPLLTGSASQPR